MTKFYGLKSGKNAGVYCTLDEIQQATLGLVDPVYAGFDNYADAVEFADNSSRQMYVDADDLDLNDYDVIVHTDGGCRNHGNNKGGHVLDSDSAAWACLIEDKTSKKVYSSTNGELGKTNNYMETRAVMRSLQILIKLGLQDKKILFVCDSKYALYASNMRWLEKKAQKNFSISNGEIWNHIYNIEKSGFKNNITWAWTHGHEGEEGNEFVDHLLNKTMDKLDAIKKIKSVASKINQKGSAK